MRLAVVPMALSMGCQLVFPLEGDIECPGYSTSDAGRFRFVDEPLSWIDAEATCVLETPSGSALGTHLATPDSRDKLLAMRVAAGVEQFWVGAARNRQDSVLDFRTLGNLPLPSELWNPSQPSNNNSNEFAVHVDNVGLNDRNPNITLPFLCECDDQEIDDNFAF